MVEVFLTTEFEGGRPSAPGGQDHGPGELSADPFGKEVTHMGGTRGYRSYRGRTSQGQDRADRGAGAGDRGLRGCDLAAELCGLRRGRPSPCGAALGRSSRATGQEETPLPPDEVQVTIQGAGGTAPAGGPLPAGRAADPVGLGGGDGGAAAQPACGAAVISVKDREGHVRFPTGPGARRRGGHGGGYRRRLWPPPRRAAPTPWPG